MLRTGRFFAEARNAWQKIACTGSREAACRLCCTPPHAAEADRSDACSEDEHVCSDDRDVRAVTEHGGAAIGNADATHGPVLYPSAGRLDSVACAGGRSRLPYCLDATACRGSVKSLRLPEAAGVARTRRAQLSGRETRPLRLVGRDEARPTNGSGPRGPTPESPPVGGRCSRWRTSRPRLPVGWVAATNHDQGSKKAGQNLDDVKCDPALFLGKKPRENFPDVECDRGVFSRA